MKFQWKQTWVMVVAAILVMVVMAAYVHADDTGTTPTDSSVVAAAPADTGTTQTATPETATPTVATPTVAALTISPLTTTATQQTALIAENSDGTAVTNSDVDAAITGTDAVTPITVTISNTGDSASDGVTIAPVGDTSGHLQLWVQDSRSTWHDLNTIGIGAVNGFIIPGDQSTTIMVYVISDAVGTYSPTIKVISASDGSTEASATGTIAIVAPVIVPPATTGSSATSTPVVAPPVITQSSQTQTVDVYPLIVGNTAEVDTTTDFRSVLGNANIASISLFADISTPTTLIANHPVIINGNGHTITYTGITPAPVFEAYNTYDVELNSLKLAGGSDGLFIDSASASITTVDVSGNSVAGVSVGNDTGSQNPGLLLLDGSLLDNTEAYNVPTISTVDNQGSIAAMDQTVDISTFFTANTTATPGQTQYYTQASNAQEFIVSLNPASAAATQSSVIAENADGTAVDNSLVQQSLNDRSAPSIGVSIKNNGVVASDPVQISAATTQTGIQLWAQDTTGTWYDVSVAPWPVGLSVAAQTTQVTPLYVVSTIPAGVYQSAITVSMTATPQATVATADASITITIPTPVISGGSSGGGGGGGGITYAATGTASAATGYDAGCFGNNKYSVTTGTLCTSVNTNPHATAPAGQVLGAETYHFTTYLKIGSRGDAVVQLQTRLNADGCTVGTIDGKFGILTKIALMKWQKTHNIPAVGTVGPLTRAALNA